MENLESSSGRASGSGVSQLKPFDPTSPNNQLAGKVFAESQEGVEVRRVREKKEQLDSISASTKMFAEALSAENR